MNTQDLEKLSFVELGGLNLQLLAQYKVPFFEPLDPNSDEGVANAELGRRLQEIREEIDRRKDTDEAKSYWDARHKAQKAASEAAEAEHKHRYTTDADYKTRVDAAWQEWARLEDVEAQKASVKKEADRRIGEVRSTVGKAQSALSDEYQARLYDLACDVQARLNNAGVPFEKRLEILKLGVQRRLPSLKMDYKARVRAAQFEYKDTLTKLYREHKEASDAFSAASWATLSGRGAYCAAIGDNGYAITPSTTKGE